MKFKESVATAVIALYPEYRWKPWRFHKAPNGFWRQLGARLRDKSDSEAIRTLREFLKDIQLRLKLESETQWQQYLSNSDTLPLTIKNQVMWLGGLGAVLELAYPHIKWEIPPAPSGMPKS